MESIEIKKAKTHKGRLHLNSLAAKLKEDPKDCLFLNTDNSSEIMKLVMNNLVKNKLYFISS